MTFMFRCGCKVEKFNPDGRLGRIQICHEHHHKYKGDYTKILEVVERQYQRVCKLVPPQHPFGPT